MKCNYKLSQIAVLLLFSLFTFTACNTDDNDNNNGNNTPNQENIPDTFSEYFGNSINRDFIGTIVNSSNQPIEGATISIGNATSTTDSNGVFIIRDASVNQRFAYIKAEKSGYIHGSRSVVPTQGVNKVTIMLLEANVVGSTNSGASETIALQNGASVSFDGNFIKEDGTAYTGNVDVIIHHLDPMDENMNAQMPGMLYAENEDGAERMLQTLGMLAIELRGTGGEDLNLAEGSVSEIRVPVDPSLMANAPATIPLWYFDETTGYWKEEGQATLQGNMYVGTVTHFSFWNCDIPAEAITLCITASDEDSNLLSNLYATITSATFGTTSGYFNDNGEVCGYVPSGETLELNIYSYDFCDTESIYTGTIGPFNSDSNISVTVSDNSNIISETITGNFNTCNGTAVTDGYVQLTYGNQTFTDIVTDGTFEINLLRCDGNETFEIIANDYTNLQTTSSITYTFTTPSTNIGTISACNAVEEFIQYTIDDGDTVFVLGEIQADFFEAGQGQVTDNATLNISGFQSNNCFYAYAVLNEPDYLGTYDQYNWNSPGDTGFNIAECISISENSNNIIYNLTALGDVGEYIDVNFSGSYIDFDGNTHTINGVIHVLRDQ